MSGNHALALSSHELADDGSQRRRMYGIQSMRLNPTMCTDAPLYDLYDEFHYRSPVVEADDDFVFSDTTDNNEVMSEVHEAVAAAAHDVNG